MRLFIVVTAWCLLPLLGNGQGVITGQVTDPAGEALAGANVWVQEARRGTSANEQGVYRLENLVPGKYTLRISYVGYEPERRTTTVQDGTWKTILHVQMREEIVSLESLVVRATRAGSSDPFTYTNLDETELAKRNLGQDVPYLLRWTPSAVVTSDAGTGIGYTGIRIRGTDPTRINVTINGIPLNDAESQGVFWVDLPDFISSTNDVQIQRGVGTSTNGAGAFGATINLRTTQLNSEPYAEIAASAGTFNTLRGNVQFGSGLLQEHFLVEGRLSRIRSDGYIDRASADLTSYFLSGAYVDAYQRLRLNIFSGQEVTYQAWNGVPAAFVDDPNLRTYNSAGAKSDGTFHENEVDDYTQTHYQVLHNRQWNPNWNSNLGLHYTRGYGFFEQYREDESLPDYGLLPPAIDTTIDLIRRLWLDNHFYGTTFDLGYTSNGNRLQLILGGAWNRYEGRHFGEITWAQFTSNAEPDQVFYENEATKEDGSFFAKAKYNLSDPLNAYLDLQFRSIRYSFVGLNRQGQELNQIVQMPFFNPKAGLFYTLDESSSAYASFAVAHREPNRNDFTESSPESRPRPEQLFNTELGWKKSWKQAAAEINGYHMGYRDQLVLTGQLNDVGEYTRINVPQSYRLGLELQGSLQLNPRWEVGGNATLSRNKVLGFTEYLDVYDDQFAWQGQTTVVHGTTDLAFSPNFLATASLSWMPLADKWKKQPLGLELDLLGKYVGPQFIDNTSDAGARLEAYYFCDFRVGASWKALELNVLVQNVLNQQFETNAWIYRYEFDGNQVQDIGLYPQAGRNFLLGLKVKLPSQ